MSIRSRSARVSAGGDAGGAPFVTTCSAPARKRPQGVAKLVVQQREKRMGRHPATGARVEIPAKQVVKARIAKQLKDVVEA